MDRFDEDDLHDYENESFEDEDSFDDLDEESFLEEDEEPTLEETELLEEMIPEARKYLNRYPEISDEDIQGALLFNQFDLMASIEELKNKYRKPKTSSTPAQVKKVKINFSKPSPDDVILNAQKSAFDANGKAKEAKEDTELTKKISDLKITPTKPKTKIDLDLELAKRQGKPNIAFVVIGHVDAGKSTLTGRLLLENNVVSQSNYNKLKREAEKAGKSSFSLAWVMDQTSEERSRGVTIDICSSEFSTDQANFTIVDAPGHKDFVPNTITGVSQADIAVLVVDSSTDAFESGFNLDGQTKEHTILARSLGISKVIVAINKMDNNDWNQDRYDEITSLMTEFLKITGWKENQMSFIPCSGLTGVNVSKKSNEPKLNWYKGDCLLDCLEKTDRFDRDHLKPFVMQINDVESTSNEFTGRIDTGIIQPGETVVFAPSNQYGVVDSITINDVKSPVGIAGDFVKLKVKSVETDEILIGDVVSVAGNDIPSVKKFQARLVLFHLSRPLLVGTEFVLFRGNIQQAAKIVRIESLLNKVTGDVLKNKPRHLSSNQSAIVEIETDRSIPLQLFKDNKKLGRIVMRKDGQTIAAGIVEKL